MRKRTQLFVDRPVQGSLLRQLLIHWLLACAVIFVFLFCFEIFKGGFGRAANELFAAMWEQYGILVIALVSIFPVFALDSIRLSHRFTGPMVPFGRALEKLSKGQRIDPVNFRDSDFWRHLSTDLNSLAQKLDLLDSHSEEKTA